MTIKHLRIAAVIAALLQFGAGEPASAASPGKNLQIGTTLPDNFPAIENFYLGKPIFGFGSAVGRVDQAVRPGRLLPLTIFHFPEILLIVIIFRPHKEDVRPIVTRREARDAMDANALPDMQWVSGRQRRVGLAP